MAYSFTPKTPEVGADTNIQYNETSTDANSIVMMSEHNEMIRVAKDGFYVRGVRVPADDKEAEIVYNAFKEWLTWAKLSDMR